MTTNGPVERKPLEDEEKYIFLIIKSKKQNFTGRKKRNKVLE
jgi:hypothetical protein